MATVPAPVAVGAEHPPYVVNVLPLGVAGLLIVGEVVQRPTVGRNLRRGPGALGNPSCDGDAFLEYLFRQNLLLRTLTAEHVPR